MLYGIDVSNYQNEMDFSKYDFVIMKASEGVGYKDKMLDTHYNHLHGKSDGKPDTEKLYGFYHYARPDLGNAPESEADWFLSLVGHHAGHCIYALDWEQSSLAYDTDWCLRWLNHVYEKTGVKPLLYIQASQEWTGKYDKIKKADYGLWVAHWGVQEPTISNWNVWAMWQFQGSPLDSNYFNGDRETYKAYCKSFSRETSQDKPKPAPTPKPTIKVGSKVKPVTRYDYNGVQNDKWILNTVFDVMEMKGNRVVIGRKGSVTGAWNKKDLKLV